MVYKCLMLIVYLSVNKNTFFQKEMKNPKTFCTIFIRNRVFDAITGYVIIEVT